MQIIDTDKDGMIVILFDTRWQYPETLGYAPNSPQYKYLRALWEEAMRDDNEEENCNETQNT